MNIDAIKQWSEARAAFDAAKAEAGSRRTGR